MTREYTCTKQTPNKHMGTQSHDENQDGCIFHFGDTHLIKVGDKVKIEQGVGYLTRRIWVNDVLVIDKSDEVIKSNN